jgi:HPt (histidine-containing phosphotransfer) domain-containing protein
MAPGAAPDAACIDCAAGLERVIGDRAMYLRVLARFRSEYRDMAMRLRAALAAGELPLAQRIAHTLKGAAAMIEARELRRLGADVEHQLRSGAPIDTQLVDRLEAELARVLAQLDVLVEPAAPDAPAEAAGTLGAPEIARLAGMLDTGDSAAQVLIEDQGEALRTLLGAPRMTQLQAAVACFDFEEALRVLRLADGYQPPT